MDKYEIEMKIFEEMAAFMESMGDIPVDKGLPKLGKKAWEVADKYDTDGPNVINILLKRLGDKNSED